jgi:long-chain acyl-CoA synthetase
LDKDLEGVMMRRGEILIGGPAVCDGYLVDPENPDPDIVAKNKEDFVTIDGMRHFV